MNKCKYFSKVLLCLLLINSVSACPSESESPETQTKQDMSDTENMTPDEIVKAMADAFFEEQNAEKAYSYWSESAKAQKNLEQYLNEAQAIFAQTPKNAIKYNISLKETTDNTASVMLSLSMPDTNAILEELDSRGALTEEQKSELQQIGGERNLRAWVLKHGISHFENNDLEIPYKEDTQTLNLVREAGGWRVNNPNN